jgi:hypothetical protein
MREETTINIESVTLVLTTGLFPYVPGDFAPSPGSPAPEYLWKIVRLTLNTLSGIRNFYGTF